MVTAHQRSLFLISAWALLVAGAPDSQSSPTGFPAPNPPPQLENGAEPIPANGALLITGGISASLSIGVEVTVKDDQGHALSGDARIEGTYVVWTPSEPFVAGASYTVSLLGSNVSSAALIKIGPVRTATRPALMSALALRRIEVIVDTKCCTSLAGFPAPSNATTCVPTMKAAHAGLNVTLTSAVPTGELDQFLFRVTDAESSEKAMYRHDLTVPELNISKQADEYCIRVEALDFASGMVFAYDDLMQRCAARGALGDLTSMPVSFNPAAFFNRFNCQVPPVGYEAMWCSTNASACDGDRSASGCEDYGHLCLGESAPIPPAADSGGRGSAAGSAPLADTGAAGAAGTFTKVETTPRAQGCAVSAPGASGRGLSALCLVLSAALLAARRRRLARGTARSGLSQVQRG